MQRIYLDYAASTPVAPEVERAMRPYFIKEFGNAGSLHSFGQKAMAAIDESRETIAKAIGADFREVIFTASATESNNIALRGITQTARRTTRNFFSVSPRTVRVSPRPRLIISAIEHESVLETARDLAAPFINKNGASLAPPGREKDGVEVVYLPVSKGGIVDLKKLKESLNERTILVSVMYANNEIGTIQPIAEISEIIRNFRETRDQRLATKGKDWSPVSGLYPLFHTDAVQAFQFLDCDVKKLGVDLMTLSAHKIYGPKGIGALYVRSSAFGVRNEKDNRTIRTSNLEPIITGGGQEFGLRSGTENVPLIVGFAKAVSLAAKLREKESKRIGDLRDYLWRELKKIYPPAQVNGQFSSTNNESISNKRIREFGTNSLFADILPNFLNVYFPDYKAEDLLTRFDLAGIAVSAGSACAARSTEPSYVIKTLVLGMKQPSRSIRITLGRPTSKKDIDITLKLARKLFATNARR